MQSYAEGIKNQVWSRLETIFKRYSGGKLTINADQLEKLAQQILKEEDPNESAYLIRNLHRIDTDNNGQIDFEEFGNFLLKRHCGQIALQRMHKSKLIAKQGEQKLKWEEFHTLLHNAYHFLSVAVDEATSRSVFRETDKDNDGYITYVQYFKFIEKFIMRDTSAKKDTSGEKKQKKTEYQVAVVEDDLLTRFRRYLWVELFRVFLKYEKEGLSDFNSREFLLLLQELINESNQSTLQYILKNAFPSSVNGNRFIFNDFAVFLIKYICEMALDRWGRARGGLGKRNITVEEFIELFKNTFTFLFFGDVNESFLRNLFSRLDKNRNGYITYKEYLQWMLELLNYREVSGMLCYLELSGINTNQKRPVKALQPSTPVQIVPSTSKFFTTKIRFTSRNLAELLKQHTLRFLSSFDANRNSLAEKDEIIEILKKIFGENSDEIFYVVQNFFRYTRKGEIATFEDFVAFFLGHHCGEITVQRFHRGGRYSRGGERIMSQREFTDTLVEAFRCLGYTANTSDIRTLWNDIDLPRQGWITYQQFFESIKEYFSYSMPVEIHIYYGSQVKIEHRPVDVQSIQDRLGSLIRQLMLLLLSKYDFNNTLEFDLQAIIALLRDVLELSPYEIEYVLRFLSRYDINGNGLISYDELANFFFELFCAEVILWRLHKERRFSRWQDRLISQQEFINLFRLAFTVFKYDFSNSDLIALFQYLDTNGDGFISYLEWFRFVRQFLGSRRGLEGLTNDAPAITDKVETVSKQEAFGDEIREATLRLIKKYDANFNLLFETSEIIHIMKDVFNENQNEIDYVVKNVFRYDRDNDGMVTYDQMTNFILQIHCGEIALQRLHKEKVFPKWQERVLRKEDYVLAMTNAFAFLGNMLKKETLAEMFDFIDTDKDGLVSYSQYFQFIRDYMGSKRAKVVTTTTVTTTSGRTGATSTTTFQSETSSLLGRGSSYTVSSGQPASSYGSYRR